MPWYRKEDLTPFDDEPIDGLYFIHGTVLGAMLGGKYAEWLDGDKFPNIEFPSGESFALQEGLGTPIVHVFGELDLPYRQDRDDAFLLASDIAEQCGYGVQKIGTNQMEVRGQDDDEHYLITYDNEAYRITDILPVKDGMLNERPVHPGHILLPDDIREKLPPLYANEDLGMEAVAQVKYFSPQSNWTWYPTEFDPQKGIFFGLVVGFDIELGYFSIEELEEVGKDGGHILPIERDLYFEPTTLAEIKKQHEQ
jgi:hypothetical protein